LSENFNAFQGITRRNELMKFYFMIAAFAAFCFGFSVQTTTAQVVTCGSLTTATYTESFDTQNNSLTNGPDGTTSVVVPVGVFFIEAGTSANNNGLYTVDDGSNDAADTYAFRSRNPLGTGTAIDTDLALGSINAGTLTPIRYGLCLQNTTTNTINRLVIDYRGEQWRQGSATTDTLVFEYCLGGACTPISGAYTAVAGLNFTAPNTTAPTGLLDGNRLYDPATDPPSENLGGRRNVGPVPIDLTLPPNGIIYLRWTDSDVTGTDDGLAIDTINVAPIAPTAAGTSISGRVTDGQRGLSRVMLMLSGGDLEEPIYVSTNIFGNYEFENLSVGQTYVVQVFSKKHHFPNTSLVVSPQENITDADFVASPRFK
jgi:hypothetical protein